LYLYVFAKFVLQRHERNIKGRNQLVKKFADEYHFAGNFALLEVDLHLRTAFLHLLYLLPDCTPRDFMVTVSAAGTCRSNTCHLLLLASCSNAWPLSKCQ